MNRRNINLAMAALLMCCCEATGSAPAADAGVSKDSEPAKASTTTVASTSKKSPYETITGVAKLKPGDEVGVCWREAKANPFAANTADYNCKHRAKSVPFPGDKTKGALSGEAIFKALQPALGARKMKVGMAKSLGPKLDPKIMAGGLSIENESNGFYGNYVYTDSASRHWLFIDVTMLP